MSLFLINLTRLCEIESKQEKDSTRARSRRSEIERERGRDEERV
jgi:hypothetical protein